MADAQPTLTVEAAPPPTQAQMKNEIASIDKAIHESLFYGGNLKVLINADPVLRQRGGAKGLAIYADLARDAHCGSVLDKRIRAVTAREWFVDPASKHAHDMEVAEFVEQCLKGLRFDKLSKRLLSANLKGFSVAEIIWERDGNRVKPRKFKARNQRRFVFDDSERLRLLTKEKPVDGELLPDRKFVVHTAGDSDDDSPYGLGLGYRLFWPVFFKRQAITFWLIFADKFGSPTAVGKYPSGTSDTDQEKLLRSLMGISQDGAVIVPDGMVVELLEAARSGTSDAYFRLCEYMDAEISKAVLGETLTTNVSSAGGSRAQATVHDDVRMEVAKDDADDLCSTLNDSLVKWIVDLNFPGSAYPTVWRVFDEPEDLKAVAERDKTLDELGWQRTDESFIETFGNGYERKPKENSQPPGATPTISGGAADNSAASFSEAGFFKRFFNWLSFSEPSAVERQRTRKREDQDTIADGATALAGNWQELIGPRVAELQTVLDETGDLAIFSERLQEMIESEPNKEVVDAIARATFSSRLAGRSSRGKQSEVKN